MLLSDAIIERIYNLCEERDISINKLCTICGITQSTLSNIVNISAKHTEVLTIMRICRGLGIEIKDFFDDPKFDNIEDD